MELVGSECKMCGLFFLHQCITGEYECPECKEKIMMYCFDETLTDEEIELSINIAKDVKNVFDNYGMEDMSYINILDLILGE